MNKEETHKLCLELEEAQELLAPFGLYVIGYSPGVSAVDELRRSFDLPSHVWNWLKPLLCELKEVRKAQGVKEHKSNE